jgi:DNA repair exonuclease SbcCD ATPase subunit
MKMKTKVLGGIGALVVTMSATGAVAYAGTTSASNNHQQYVSQIKTERQEIKSLQAERQQLNQQIKTYVESFKGKHLQKTNKAAFKSIKETHQDVIAARAKLKTDDVALKADRQSKNWAQLSTDLQTKTTDLQSLVKLKQQQVTNLQSVNTSGSVNVAPASSASTAE